MNDDVRAQYQAYPYPPRDPADEARRLITGSPSHILEIDHFLYAGARDFTAPFRALVAGGGTGDATIMLAQQLADSGGPGEVVYLDLSDTTLGIARARAEARGLSDLRFVQGSILDLATLGLGEFDYIDCCGVLHHLDDPLAGLQALRGALAPDGGMGLMLYAPLGRTGVYHAQAMLRMLAGDAGDTTKLDVARRLLNELPPTNWLKRNPFVSDHATLGDAGIYDLLLHSQDRAFNVLEFADLVAKGGMRLVAFSQPLRYEPSIYLRDPDLNSRLAGLPPIQRCAFAELLCGNMKTHIAYAVRGDNNRVTIAAPDSGAVVPVLRDLDGAAMARELTEGKALTIDLEGIKASFNLPRLAAPLLAAIDGKRNLDEISAAIPGTTPQEFSAEFQQLYLTLNGLGRMYLRRPGASVG